jgi:prephenate dehydratase
VTPERAFQGRRVAFQGVPGAFSHEAALQHLPGAELQPCESFAALFDALASGSCALAFVPVENTIAGPVPEVAERLSRPGLVVLAEHDWPISMHLMAHAGASLRSVQRVASHPMALKQCARFLARHAMTGVEAFDTAGAAAALAGQADLSQAAIAPRAAARLYGLTLLAEDIQDRADNLTRFLLLRSSG